MISWVSCEFILICLDANIRKYFSALDSNDLKDNYWNTPNNLKKENVPFPKQKRAE